MKNSFDIRMLNPAEISLSRNKGGVLQGVIDGQTYEEIVVYRAFPFKHATSYISIRKAGGEELGIVHHIDELDEESAFELNKELQFRYFLPKVTRVDSVKNKSGLWLWELQTHLGTTKMAMRNLHEHLQYPGGGRIILTDLNGKRCEITEWQALDSHSRNQLKEVL
ncbi:hypothetical protein PAT3040_01541 [Paenibacillus agaridevorans]|uniref:DUF1854 domain-containing protein n=1 Tax=Paenibacillus agaridevorans TaxID=171404 RepID=A0A2R5EUE3_9BACL|nr:DUF1854 domain-containing protein [Paenibacillus agaridevorans]GBG06994.1 hypothetical protein PAT3040_01541 [Paenibacillus agaridevorans]